MANKVHLPVAGLGNTLRKDAWWGLPLVTFSVITTFIVYATYRVFENKFYEVGPYLSPFYSPLIPTQGFGIAFLSPAMLILPAPLSFRLTCYYYRKAYYRSFGMDPPACAVGEPRGTNYNGERKLWIFQNLHRFTLYVAIAVLFFLWHDFYKALWFNGKLGVGLGTIVLFVNPLLLSLYTFSCHAFRHMIGGDVNSYSTAPGGELRFKLWTLVSKMNTKHPAYAWMSLFGVGLTDFYVRSVASGAIQDIRFF